MRRHSPTRRLPRELAEFDPALLDFEEWRAARRRYAAEHGVAVFGGAADMIAAERRVRLALARQQREEAQ